MIENRRCGIACFFNDGSSAQAHFNDSAQLYFTKGICFLHGKLTAVSNFTLVKLTNMKFSQK